jgi:hypothetical protein
MSPSKNLIIGAAIGYREPQLAPFVRSLARVGYTGDLALIVDPDLASALRRAPLYARHEIVEAPRWIPHRLGLRGPFQWRLWRVVQEALRGWLWIGDRLPATGLRWHLQYAVARHCYWPTETRYLHAYEYLRNRPYRRVLLSDVRDVLFQADPFAGFPQSGLAVGMETRRLTLATEPFNAKQVTMAYGPDGLRRIGGRPISCCGVTYGDRDSMLRYLELMIREIWRLGPFAARHPMDQALHNHILWTGAFGDFTELDTLASPIATLAMLDEAELKVGADNRLLNRDGTIPSIVHQHDRWPQLAARLEQALARAAA